MGDRPTADARITKMGLLEQSRCCKKAVNPNFKVKVALGFCDFGAQWSNGPQYTAVLPWCVLGADAAMEDRT